LAQQYNWTLTGNEYKCEACAFTKSKQKAVPKATATRATKIGERLFIDISGPFANTPRNNKYWVMVVDDYTRKKWSLFIRTRDEIATATEKIVVMLNGANHQPKYI